MERYRGKTGDDITLDPDGDIVLYADAQATIAALQAQHKLARDAWWESAKELESQLTQRTAERDTARRRVDELEAREVDVVMLREDLEQRTAELERVRGERDAADALNSEMIVLLADYVGETGVSEGAVDVLRRKLVELATLRTLIAALPKVEGELTCSQQIDSAWRLHYWQVEAYGVADECIYRLSNLGEEEAKAYAALLQHRQGMEG